MLKYLAAPLIGLKGKAGNKLWDYSEFCVKKSHSLPRICLNFSPGQDYVENSLNIFLSN
jgi:hypothetical protein